MILGPIAAGAGLFCLKPDAFRKGLVAVLTLAVCLCAFALAKLPSPIAIDGFPLPHRWLNFAMSLTELGMGAYVIFVGIRARRPFIVLLMLTQGGLIAWLEWTGGSKLEAVHNLFVDQLSVVMALINVVVGGGICLDALGYMRDYHESAHREIADRRPFFFSLL